MCFLTCFVFLNDFSYKFFIISFSGKFSVTTLTVAVRMALFVTRRLTTPGGPPAMNPPVYLTFTPRPDMKE